MSGSKEPVTLIPFGAFEADLTSQELRKQDVRLPLPRQSFQILKMLLERPGELVTREELRAALWPADTSVDFEHGSAINRLRETLGDDADNPRYIETLPQRGYRFVAKLTTVASLSSPTSAEAAPAPAPTRLPQGAPPQKRRIFATSIVAVVIAFGLVIVLNVASLRTRLWRTVGPLRETPSQIPDAQARLASGRPVNPEAYELYLKGRYEWNKRTEEGLKKGLEYFQQAINLDPTYALAYSGLADSYSVLGNNGSLPGAEVYPKAKAAALRAFELDKNLAEAHASLGLVLFEYAWDHEVALKEYETAIELNPNYATAHHWYAVSLALMGRSEEAIREIEQAQRLDPLSVRISANVALILYEGRQYDQAIIEARKALELEPNDGATHFRLGDIYLQKGMPKEALAEFQYNFSPEERAEPPADPNLIRAYAAAGNRRGAQRLLVKLKQQSKREYISPWCIARAFVALGENEEALVWTAKGLRRLRRRYGAPEGRARLRPPPFRPALSGTPAPHEFSAIGRRL